MILGSAAGLVAISGASAADLPVKAKAVEYVRICSAYGAGFWYVPGTDTCMKIGGYLRVESDINASAHNVPFWSGDAGQNSGMGNRYADELVTRSRMNLTVDTRTMTEYGVVRTFGSAHFQFTTLGGNSYNPNSINQTVPVAGAQLLDTPGGGYVTANNLFIQFAGFTFGKSASAFSAPWYGYLANNTAGLLGGYSVDEGVNNIQYTAEFGNGLSGTISLEDPVVFDRTAVYNLSTALNATLNTGNAYAGVHAPDVVGRFRVDQAWGLFQVSAAAHEVSGSYNILNGSTNPLGGVFGAGAPAGATGLVAAAPISLSEISGHPDTKWGGAVAMALNVKNIPTGPGDDFKMDATYSKGDTKTVISTTGTSPSFAMFGATSNPAAYQSIGFGATTDAVWMPAFAGGDGNLHLTEAFGARAAFTHNWDPYWNSSLFGSYSAVRYDGAAKAAICTNYTTPAKAVSADYSCNPNFNIGQVGFITRWTPVKNLTFSAEVFYTHLDQMFTGSAVLGPSAPKPTARYEFADQDTVSLNIRAQRNF
jgi:hypothetical protein